MSVSLKDLAGPHTFSQLPSVQLTSFELNGDNMAQRFMEQFNGNTETSRRHC